MAGSLFRKKVVDKISSPEQLSEYLRVTNPGIWIILMAVIFLIAGVFAWSVVGTLETSADATAIVYDGKATIVIIGTGEDKIEKGMKVTIENDEYVISSTETDEFGRSAGFTDVDLPEGSYEAEVTVDEIHPISFLVESR